MEKSGNNSNTWYSAKKLKHMVYKLNSDFIHLYQFYRIQEGVLGQ